jgi:hypothetical protein
LHIIGSHNFRHGLSKGFAIIITKSQCYTVTISDVLRPISLQSTMSYPCSYMIASESVGGTNIDGDMGQRLHCIKTDSGSGTNLDGDKDRNLHRIKSEGCRGTSINNDKDYELNCIKSEYGTDTTNSDSLVIPLKQLTKKLSPNQAMFLICCAKVVIL